MVCVVAGVEVLGVMVVVVHAGLGVLVVGAGRCWIWYAVMGSPLLAGGVHAISSVVPLLWLGLGVAVGALGVSGFVGVAGHVVMWPHLGMVWGRHIPGLSTLKSVPVS